MAVFSFDLDGLKGVNDTLGHDSGDRLLQTMAVFLRQFFRGGDRILRVGGDEFAMLLPSATAAEAGGPRPAVGARRVQPDQRHAAALLDGP